MLRNETSVTPSWVIRDCTIGWLTLVSDIVQAHAEML